MKMFQIMYKYIRHHPALWLIGLILPPVFNLVSRLIYANANKIVVAQLSGNIATYTSILWILGAALFGMVIAEIMQCAARCIYAKFIIITQSDVKQDLFIKLMGCLWGDITSINSGELFTHYNQDVKTAVATISDDIFDIINPLVMGVGYCTAIFLSNWILGVITTFLMVVVILQNTLFVNRYRTLEKEKRARQEDFTLEVDSALQGKMSIRMMSFGDKMTSALAESSESIAENERRTIRLNIHRALTMDWFATTCTTMILPLACLLATLNMINVPNVIFVAQLCGTLIIYTKSLGLAVTRLSSDMVSVERLKDFMRLPSETLGDTHKIHAQEIAEMFTLDRVSFSYGDKLILENASMSVNQGEIVALVGASGSGKSSIMKALLRLIDYSGTIRLWGRDIKEYPLGSLRASIAYVPENNDLIDGTLMENLSLGDPMADAARVKTAMEWAALGEFIKESDYENHYVGERGSKLSGGQRQRIAIARAFLKDAPILLMDEPTASLDTVSEKLVLERLQKMSREGKSIIIITHRESTIKIADRIFMIDGETIRENVPLEQATDLLRHWSVSNKTNFSVTLPNIFGLPSRAIQTTATHTIKPFCRRGEQYAGGGFYRHH